MFNRDSTVNFPDLTRAFTPELTKRPCYACSYICMRSFFVIWNPQELEQCLLEKEQELKVSQSRATEMEQELHTALQEKQVSKETSYRH